MGKASTRKKPKESPGGRLAARDAARPTSAVASKLLSSSFRDPLQLSQGDNEEPFTEEENIALAPNSLDGEGEEAAPAVLVSRKVAVPVVSRGNSVKQALDLLDSPRAEGIIEDVVPSSIESFTGQRGGGYGQGEDTQPSQPQSQGSQSQTQSVKRKRGQHDLTVAPQPAVGWTGPSWFSSRLNLNVCPSSDGSLSLPRIPRPWTRTLYELVPLM
jgi:hypothetical protein